VKSFNDGKIQILFIIKESIPDRLDLSKGTVIILETNVLESVKKAHFAVPIQVFCESEGTFTNKNNLTQKFEKALEPIKGLPSSGEFFDKLLVREEASVGNY
jgi:NADH-quinone oxidoreductase subunit G